MTGRFLPGVPGREIEVIFDTAPGNEIATGKFDSPESSAALAANAFGYFLRRAPDLPILPGCGGKTWRVRSLALEATVRFPWPGGRHPVLDCLVETRSSLIGIESKRFEPYRPKRTGRLSDAYWRPRWGKRMEGYKAIRDGLRDKPDLYRHLDAAQLFKHAFALRTAVHRPDARPGLEPILFYVYAEPRVWPKDGRAVDERGKARHREEIARFCETVNGDEVAFVPCSYRLLLKSWAEQGNAAVSAHAKAVTARFAP